MFTVTKLIKTKKPLPMVAALILVLEFNGRFSGLVSSDLSAAVGSAYP